MRRCKTVGDNRIAIAILLTVVHRLSLGMNVEVSKLLYHDVMRVVPTVNQMTITGCTHWVVLTCQQVDTKCLIGMNHRQTTYFKLQRYS